MKPIPLTTAPIPEYKIGARYECSVGSPIVMLENTRKVCGETVYHVRTQHGDLLEVNLEHLGAEVLNAYPNVKVPRAIDEQESRPTVIIEIVNGTVREIRSSLPMMVDWKFINRDGAMPIPPELEREFEDLPHEE